MMANCSFTFGQLEELLATIHHIAPDRRVAFQGRLKHLQRWGFPTKEKPGKGKAIGYTVEHLFRAVLALEFIQAGISPKFAIDLVEANWGTILPTVYLNSYTGTERVKFGGGSAHDWCWLVRPEALRGLTEGGERAYDCFEAIHAIRADTIAEHLTIDSSALGSSLGTHWRNLVINGGSLVRGVMTLIELRLEWATRESMVADLKAALDAREAYIREALDSFDPGFKDTVDALKSAFAANELKDDEFCALYPELVPAAKKLLDEMPDGMGPILLASKGSEVEMSKEVMRYMADNRLLAIEADELSMTPLFFVASELFRRGSE